MKVVFLVNGKTNVPAVEALEQQYYARIKHYFPFERVVLKEIKLKKGASPEQLKQQEAQVLDKFLQAGDLLVLLDEKGKEYHSRGFAQQIQNWFNQSPKRLIFCVGGAYGFAPETYARAQAKLSISKMTFSHQIIRALFAEQLYRAATILKGDPYHND